MATRRPILKRVTIWTAAAVLLLAGYAASAPFAFFWSQHHLPRAIPTLKVVYAPLIMYSQHTDWPGSRSYNRFQSWSYAALQEYFDGLVRADDVLDAQTEIQFSSTPLRDVVGYIGEIHDYPVELDADVNGDMEITIDSTASLRDSLQEMLEPHGLVAAPDEERIVIATPAAIERIIAQRRAANPLTIWGPWIALVIGITILGIAALLIRLAVGRRHVVH